jgi:hypothetical protein
VRLRRVLYRVRSEEGRGVRGYLPVQVGTGTRVRPNKRLISTAPDWNNEAFLSR